MEWWFILVWYINSKISGIISLRWYGIINMIACLGLRLFFFCFILVVKLGLTIYWWDEYFVLDQYITWIIIFWYCWRRVNVIRNARSTERSMITFIHRVAIRIITNYILGYCSKIIPLFNDYFVQYSLSSFR